jgi:hypothetical protein
MRVGSQSESRLALAQRVESSIAQNYRGRQMTVSFWIKFSHATAVSTTATIYGNFYAGIGYNTTTTDPAHGTTGWDDFFQPAVIANGSLPTSWTKYTATFTVPSNTNNIVFLTQFSDIGTSANDSYSYEITDVKIEPGTSATPFSMHAKSHAGELAACQRYYYRTTSTGGFAGIGGNGFTYSATQANVQLQLPVPMRTYPSSCDVSNIRYVDSANGAANITQVAMWQIPASVTNATVVDFQAIGTGFTSGRYVFLQTSAGNGYLGFSAEL